MPVSARAVSYQSTGGIQMNNQQNNTRLSEAGTRVTRGCPECGHQFQGHGWTGIDAHWKSKHEHVMPYDAAWKSILKGEYCQSAAADNTRLIEAATKANQDKEQTC
jgi:hypothetical protein